MDFCYNSAQFFMNVFTISEFRGDAQIHIVCSKFPKITKMKIDMNILILRIICFD